MTSLDDRKQGLPCHMTSRSPFDSLIFDDQSDKEGILV